MKENHKQQKYDVPQMEETAILTSEVLTQSGGLVDNSWVEEQVWDEKLIQN